LGHKLKFSGSLKGAPSPDPTVRWDHEDTRVTAPLGKILVDAIAPEAFNSDGLRCERCVRTMALYACARSSMALVIASVVPFKGVK
jgi:hypothetical protein